MIAVCAGTTAGQPAAAGSQAARSTVPSRIVSQIDDSVRVTLVGSRHPLARPQNDIGALAGATRLDRMILVLGASPDQEYQARTLLDSMHSKGSPNYHNWLTPEQFGQKFGPAQQDLQQITAWLTQQGFAVNGVAKSHRWIEFSGTSAQVEAAFHTQMRQYLVGGETHVANATEVSIPAALNPVVKGVASLHNFFSKPMLSRSPVRATLSDNAQGKPTITFTDGSHGIAPGDFATIYDLKPLYNAVSPLNGTGETIAVVAISNINLSDVATFRSNFLPLTAPAGVPNIILNGPDPGVDTGDAGAEATLDTEWSGAAAPNATIDVVVSGGSLTTDPVLLGAMYIVDQNLADVMSVSFGNCEAALGGNGPGNENQFWTTVWEQAAAQGISVFTAAGDTGAAGCDANAPSNTPASGGVAISGLASTQFNTAVGGTQMNETAGGGLVSTFWSPTNSPADNSSALGYIPEAAWNESCSPTQTGTVCNQIGQFLFFSGGGGVSELYQTPSYQTLGVTGLSTLNNFTLPGSPLHPRGIPDVSLSAAALNDPYIFCFSTPGAPDCQGTVSTAGGTSFSSPAFAGIMAIVDQAMTHRQGLANYVLYPLAAAETFSSCNSSSRTNPLVGAPVGCVFNDTTSGNNGVPGNDVTNDPTANALGFPTATGYDLATGLGSVDANNLVTKWTATTFQGSQTSMTATFGGITSPPGTLGTITHGQTVSVNVSVAKQSPSTTQTPGGDVSLVASGGNLPSNMGITFAPISGSSTTGSFQVSNLPGGTSYNLSAFYPGDGTFAGSSSNTIAITVGPESTTTLAQSLLISLSTFNVVAGNTIAYGDPNNLLAVDADVSGASGLLPTSGNVSFTIDGNAFNVAIDNSGISEFLDCITPDPFAPLQGCLAPGTHTVTATYLGDGPLSYNASPVSNTVTVTVTKGNPSPVITVPPNAVAGVAFTAQAQIGTGFGTIIATGTVQFFDGTTALGPAVTLSNGQASMQVTLNSAGTHSITAQYSGDTTYNGATSSAAVISVSGPFNFTTVTTGQTIAAGQTATFNITLNSSGGFTGTVNLACSGAPTPATCSLTPNSANLTASVTSVPVTVTISNTTNARLQPTLFREMPLVFAGLLGAGLLGLRKRSRQRVLIVLALMAVAGLVACGGGGGGGGTKPPTNATIVVTGTSGSNSSTVSLNLTITH